MGCSQAALATLQARTGGLGCSAQAQQALSLPQAQAAMGIYLECSTITEAFLGVSSIMKLSALAGGHARVPHPLSGIAAILAAAVSC